MHIKSTERREREWEALKEATGESTTSGALDVATRYYLRMAGGNTVEPKGLVRELTEFADEKGNVTAAEIAGILGVEELPIEYEIKFVVGHQ